MSHVLVYDDDPWIGPQQIADIAGAALQTVYSWQKRRMLPEPGKRVLANRPRWRRSVIVEWLYETGRIEAEMTQ